MGRKYSITDEKNFILLIAGILLILTFILIKDILAVIIYSIILAYFLLPIYNFFLQKSENSKISALLTLITVTVGFFIPLTLLFYFLILNMVKIVIQYKEYIENPESLNIIIGSFLEKFSESSLLSSFNYSEIVNSVVLFIISFIQNFFSSLPMALIYFLIILFITYYILIHQRTILKTLNEYIPLTLKKQNEIGTNVAKNIDVIFKGYFLTGIIQTGVAFLGYLVFGVPNLMIITFLTLITSLIPYLGTPMVWVPVGIYLILIGQEIAGIGLLIYGTLIISTIDNFLRPILMSSKDTISPPLVFIGFIGGIFAFGIQGIILGPIIISLTAIILGYLKDYYQIQTDNKS